MVYYQCPVSGCDGLSKKSGRCEKHSKQQRQETASNRGTATARGYDNRWRKIRKAYIASNPLCIKCLESGITKAVETVHHIDGNPKNNRDDNLKSLCRKHHEAQHKQ